MEHFIIAIILLIGPDHTLVGGTVLPGTSPTVEACQEKAKAAIRESIDQIPPGISVALACDETGDVSIK